MPIALIAPVVALLAMAGIPATHYVKSDDVHIAYQVLGEGSFDLLFVPGFVSNIEAAWQSPARAGLAYGQFQSGIQRAHILLAAHTIDVCSKVTSH